jgi:hypothetical protein
MGMRLTHVVAPVNVRDSIEVHKALEKVSN